MPTMESQPSVDREAGLSHSRDKRGGWITFPFIAATLTALTLAGWGWLTNLIIYLIEEFNLKSIDATQMANVVNGGISLIPIGAAIIADCFLGSFNVIAISSSLSLLGVVLLTLTASVTSLRPPPCQPGSSLCQSPSRFQFTVLYVAIALASIGLGAIRFTLATFGANQLDNPQQQGVFFNWFFLITYSASLISSIGIVYVEDSISWGLGFGICAAAGFVGLAIFLLGSRFFRHSKPQESPFTGLARVLVSSIRKRNLELSSKVEDYYHEKDGTDTTAVTTPSHSLRFFNRASLKTEGDIKSNGSIARSWRLCTVQEVENLKALVRISPLLSTTIFVAIPLAMQANMTVLQALSMNRHIGSRYNIPPGSLVVVVLLSTCISLFILDRLLLPAWKKLTGRFVTPLQRIGVGHIFNVLSMAVSAMVESRRLKIVRADHLEAQPGAVVPMLVLWLFPQLIVNGIGEAFHVPGQVALFYQEFPASLRNTATAMVSVMVGIAFYVSTALVGLIRHITHWLPDNINEGRLDNVYWTLVVLGSLNFGYYLVCSILYRYANVENKASYDSATDADSETETEKESSFNF